MQRLLILLGLMAAQLSAQPVVRAYIHKSDTTLSSTARSVTVQMPASLTSNDAQTIRGIEASVYCENGCDVTVSRDGTAATATAGTIAAVASTTSNAPVAKAWDQSDVGTGTALSVIPAPAGVPVPFDITNLMMKGAGTAKNFTLKTSAVSGRVVINIVWQEF